MKICFISDVHSRWKDLVIPECDVLVSCGDYSFVGECHLVKNFHKWLNKQKATHIISVQGNHEKWVEANFNEARTLAQSVCPRVHFIDEGEVDIDGVKFFGSAITPYFFNWAWNRYRGEDVNKHWARIPDDVNVLITHGPVYGILDQLPDGTNVGCEGLFNRIQQLDQCKIHACGHIHDAYGEKYFNGRKYINASICDERYSPTNLPILIEI